MYQLPIDWTPFDTCLLFIYFNILLIYQYINISHAYIIIRHIHVAWNKVCAGEGGGYPKFIQLSCKQTKTNTKLTLTLILPIIKILMQWGEGAQFVQKLFFNIIKREFFCCQKVEGLPLPSSDATCLIITKAM